MNISCNFHWIELTHVSSIHFDTTRPLKGSTLTRPELEGSTDNVSSVCSFFCITICSSYVFINVKFLCLQCEQRKGFVY